MFPAKNNSTAVSARLLSWPTWYFLLEITALRRVLGCVKLAHLMFPARNNSTAESARLLSWHTAAGCCCISLHYHSAFYLDLRLDFFKGFWILFQLLHCCHSFINGACNVSTLKLLVLDIWAPWSYWCLIFEHLEAKTLMHPAYCCLIAGFRCPIITGIACNRHPTYCL